MRHVVLTLATFVSAAAFAQPEAPTPVTPASPTASPTASPATPSGLSAAETSALLQRVDDLEQQHRILARQIELASEQAAAKAKDAGSVSFGGRGFILRTADGKTQVALRGLVQADGRVFFDDHNSRSPTPSSSAARPDPRRHLLRPHRLPHHARLRQRQVVLFDAYVELHPWPWLRLRAGKFKPPVGLEWLQSDATIDFIERAFPTSLVPYRDLGVMLSGDVAGGAFSYAIGVFNGAPTAPTPRPRLHVGKDYVGRLFAHPLRPIKGDAGHNLGLGVAASYGQERGRAAAPNLPTFGARADDLLQLPQRRDQPDGVRFAAATRCRLAPQLYWYIGPLGLLAEYVYSSQRSARRNTGALANQAWHLPRSFVLTPARASYDGVKPKHPLDFKRHADRRRSSWWPATRSCASTPPPFPSTPTPRNRRTGARLGAGLNWYLTANARFNLDYEHTEFFHGGAPDGTNGGAPTNRPTEHSLIGRFQVGL